MQRKYNHPFSSDDFIKVFLRVASKKKKMLNPFSFNFTFPIVGVCVVYFYSAVGVFLSALLFLVLLRFVYMSFLMFSILQRQGNKENKDGWEKIM